jgi:hypothetical protein
MITFNIYKKFIFSIIILSFIFFINFISAAEINDTFHINLQTTFSNGTIQSGTFNFAFNITESSSASCLGPLVYNYSISKATDSRGIVSLYLPTVGSGGGNLSNLGFDKQYYLCYYRDGSLKDVTQLSRVPYSFRATEVNLSEVTIDSNLSLGSYNISASSGFFSFLGSLASRISNIFATNADISNNLTVGGNLSVDSGTLFVNSNDGLVGIGITTSQNKLNVVGDLNISDEVYFLNSMCLPGEVLTADSTTGLISCVTDQTLGGGAVTGGGSSGYIVRWNGTSTINNSDIFQLGSNIGIGTITPQNTLNVVGDGNFTLDIFSRNNNLTIAYFLTTNNTFAQLTTLNNGTYANTAETDPLWSANYTNLQTACSPSFVTGIFANGTFQCGTASSSETDPFWSANYSAFLTTQALTTNNTFYLASNPSSYTTIPLVWTTLGNGTVMFASNWNATNESYRALDNLSFVGGNSSFDTDVLFVDNNNDRVGIGTSTPQNKLNIIGDANITGAVYFLNSMCLPGEVLTADSTTGLITCVTDQTLGGGAVTGGGNSGYIVRWNGTSVINNSDIFQLGSNIGIGTINPQNTLNVIGDGNFTLDIFSRNNNLTVAYFLTTNNTFAQLTTLNNGTYVIDSVLNNGSYFNAPSSGDISSINTTLDYFLYNGSDSGDVYLRFNDTRLNLSTYALLSVLNNGTYSAVDTDTFVANYSAFLTTQALTTNNTFYLASNPSSYTTIPLVWNTLGNGTVMFASNWNATNESYRTLDNLSFVGGNSSFDTDVLFVDTNNNRIGIGTTIPQNTLSIVGTTNISGATYLLNSKCNPGEVLSADATTGLISCVTDQTLGGGAVTGGGSSGYLARWNGTSTINNSDIFQLGSNIGIGTINPQNTLNVVGDINSTLDIFSRNKNLTIAYFLTTNNTFAQLTTLNNGTYSAVDTDTFVANYSAFLTTQALTTNGTFYLASNPSSYTTIPLVWTTLTNGTLALNSTLANYFTKSDILGFGYYNSTTLQNLSQLSDDILWTSQFNTTGDSRWLTSFSETDPFWSANYSAFLTTQALTTNGTFYLASNPSSYTTIPLVWTTLTNGTLLLASQWNATNTSYYLATNPFGFYNSTTLQNLSQLSDDILWTSQFNTTGDSRWLTSFSETDPFWSANYSAFLTTQALTTNNTFYLNSNPLNFINGTYGNSTYLLKTGDTATGNYTFDSGTLFIDSTNDMVGIGDTTPDHKLDVEGNIGLGVGGYINWGDTDGSTGYGFRDNAGVIEFKNASGSWMPIPTNVSAGSGSAGGWTNSSDTTSTNLNVNVNAGNFYVNTTSERVGIGTINPQNTLNVVGDINSTLDIFSRNNNLTIAYFLTTNNTFAQLTTLNNGTYANTAETDPKWSANYTNLQTACSPNFVTGIFANGTFQCGTASFSETDPFWSANYSAFLTTQALTTNNTFYLASNPSSYTTIPLVWNTLGNGTMATTSYVNTQNTSMKNYIDNTFNTTRNNYVASVNTSMKNYVDANFLLQTGDTATGNYTFDSTTLHIDSTRNRVGIGTTNPQNTLNVVGTANFTGNTTSNTDFCIIGGNCLSSVSSGAMTSWTLGASAGTNQTITDGNTAFFVAGTGITTTAAATDRLTIATTLGTAIEKGEISNSGTLGFDWVDSEISDTLTIGSGGTITWSALTSYPTACSASQTITAIGDTITCSSIAVSDTQVTDAGKFLLATGDTATGNYTFDSGTLFIDSTRDRVGIGTTNPAVKLNLNSSSDEILRVQHSSSSGNPTISLYQISTKTGEIVLNNTGSNIDLNSYYGGIKLTGGSAGTLSSSSLYINGAGNVGIGTTNPLGGKLNIVGGNLNVSNNSIVDIWKLTLSTGGAIDPPYKIGDTVYATYVPSMTGIKEETTGIINLDSQGQYIIDLNSLERGSDLWIFYQITDFGQTWEKLQVILTPGFDGRVWYSKDVINKKLIIYGSQQGEVSYRLTANRYDWQAWGNIAKDVEIDGPGLPEK